MTTLALPIEPSRAATTASDAWHRLPHAAPANDAASTCDLPLDAVEPSNERRDCEELIDTVKSSLWGLLDAPPPHGLAEPDPAEQGRLRTTAEQGAIALELLQSNLAQNFVVRQQLERDIREAHHDLEKLRAELAGTRAEERQARFLATHDQLTGLANRAHFHECLNQAIADPAVQQQGMVVMYLDLDAFKPVNDNYGHAAGDALLCIVASRLKRALRAQDLVGRLGGDEFACLLTGVGSHEQIRVLACKLREAVRAPCKIGAQMVRVDASIGIAQHIGAAVQAADILLKADMAMYRAKRDGCGIAFFDEQAG